MLVLSRRRDEKLKIGEDITITVVSIHEGAVKLGIETPEEDVVRRLVFTEDIHNSGKI